MSASIEPGPGVRPEDWWIATFRAGVVPYPIRVQSVKSRERTV